MNKQTYQPLEEAATAPEAVAVQPVIYEDPQAGGCYTRDPITGALTLDTPITENT